MCAASVLPYEVALQTLSSLDVLKGSGIEPQIHTISIPLLPPTSEEQAQQWSKEYWPTVYKRNHPFGPHPSILSRTEDGIRGSLRKWMGLAIRAGSEVLVAQKGEPIGVVIVNPNASTGPTPIVVAGDARWNKTGEATVSGGGNVATHAVIRAIGLVARKRRDLLGAEHHSTHEKDSSDIFADKPLTELESEFYSKGSLAPGGYLCLDLELYVSHEPCIMCSMAILHSRFGKVIFGKRLPYTGGISADSDSDMAESETGRPGLGYGLFWRPDLNWKLLAWQWLDDQNAPQSLSHPSTHA